MKTGAIILAASKSKSDCFSPLVEVDDITVIRRIILTLKRSGIFPITVITGEQAAALEKEIAKLQVFTLYNPDFRESYMFDNVCMGLRYIEPLCDRVLILPAKFPTLLSDTIEKIIKNPALCVRPSFQGRIGHPILLHKKLFSDILSYTGENGLRGALSQPKIRSHTSFVPIADSGTILTAEDVTKNIFSSSKAEDFPIFPSCELILQREIPFFTKETALFLMLIHHTGSMQTACKQMQISYSKGLGLIRKLEEHVPFPILMTKSGGADGGSSTLTVDTLDFLQKYEKLQSSVSQYTTQLFQNLFCGGSYEK